ncbi:hypothetical protein PHYBLDRAFT_172699 [Phycomyces blakesleeanus NRRL 1555(-)]|uniref:Uncharacterized protein n=1 Tax=Phycomyces blakesleeanus (strain ATCC 8743b / DSM 1359 / FGSC 10004 / NBRC 33097 / NRRL 1555) TaxID=763407 RepID=A0A162TIE6_PHYB8|nr:hypothetical protein PHYBLDRAFT_172699 [Phycomyces blakesleeanus NRRL 1555(-)]OAD68842.1 hypothetical protein PHYBLDRAFT_172699 [Phycomyces blakesleeanus NRRL 1555(-)]|eukprot:XP_018286882.1 hypothetical protein PHYBLDRAFT_172699 [Phycomyces blakesleeanus NRRL 1555(-)]
MYRKVPCRQQLLYHGIVGISYHNCAPCGVLKNDHSLGPALSKHKFEVEFVFDFLMHPTFLTFAHLHQQFPPCSIVVTNFPIDITIIIGYTPNAKWGAPFQFVFDDVAFVLIRIADPSALHIRRLESESKPALVIF